ncbi:putative membrane protein YczE [Aequitasia blattaphilus]|uniref:YitT family protein n=1 Tax=Aequitasia blattaphilus TaxID=2949332 RepID=A0ABT1E998_9FIRM|nr:hypothetical protein [Aequitasia blattaphilus]MCP1102406.1 hypothetical protein [Aequitasia blattaphilus]MCR8615046.1 hypothetical protein [Aequitasia blattaphilus]
MINFKKILLAVVGIFLVGIGVAFNANAALGNDPIAIVYDGMRNIANLSASQLGIASNIVNVALVAIVFIADRHYVNIGTIIYILPYGFAVDIGYKLFNLVFTTSSLTGRIIGAVLGCLMVYVGVAIYITTDIGLDPFTGIVMVIKDKWKKKFVYVKIGFDFFMITVGIILGGRFGVITILTACCAGPCIQLIADFFKKMSVNNGKL